MRTAAAWIVGSGTFLALMTLADLLGHAIGVPVRLNFNEPIVIEHQFYDEEKDSALTTFGLALTIICGMFATRIGMAIAAASWRGGVKARGELQFVAWLLGLTIYAVIGVLLFLASRRVHNGFANFLFHALDLAAAAGIAWAVKTWHDQRVTTLHDPDSEKRAI